MLTQQLLKLTLVGAEWVLWLLLGLSVISVAIMLERPGSRNPRVGAKV